MKKKSEALGRFYPRAKKLLLIMRLSIFLVLISVLASTASVYSQATKFTIKMKNSKISDVFDAIEQQSDFYFFYNRDNFDDNRLVSIDVEGKTVEKILDEIFEGKNVSYEIINRNILIKTKNLAAQQQKSVSGRVTDDTSQPLPGVTVVIKGTSHGTVTNSDGKYILTDIPEDASLLFSFVGMQTQEITVGNQQNISITMIVDAIGIEEVVAIGYGVQRKSSVVGSVAQISGEILKQAPVQNLTNMLGGRLPGLSVSQTTGNPTGNDAVLRIRGTSTYSSSGSSPLIIIDGVQRPSFSNFDPDEIESITLLKDALSTAVYGLQASNGIILVTTKRGIIQKPEVSYSGTVTVNQNTRMPKFLNGPDYMEWYNKATEVDNEYRAHKGLSLQPDLYSQEQIDALRNGTNTNPLLGNTNWVDELLGDNSLSQQHTINLRGGAENVKYFSTVGYSDQAGIIKNTSSRRYNIRTNFDAKITGLLSVSLDLSVREQNNETPGISPDDNAYLNPIFQAVRMHPNLPKYAPNGLPTGTPSGINYINPIAATELSGYQSRIRDDFQGNLSFKLKIPWIKGLEAKALFAYDKSVIERKDWRSPYTLLGRLLGQTTGDYFPILQRVPATYELETKTVLRQTFYKEYRATVQPSINYTNVIGDHSISVLALYEWSKFYNNNFSAGGSNFSLTSIQELSKRSTAPEDWIDPYGDSGINVRAGFVGRINYEFKNKYLVEIANRFDASIKFALENRWKAFPGLGLGWVISREDFFNGLSKNINYLKLRGSVGQSGNDAGVAAFSYLNTFRYANNVTVIGGNPVPGIKTSNIPNVDLKWETSTMVNLGFDGIFWNGLLSTDFEVFYKLTEDILNNPGNLYPYSIGGYVPASINYGKMENRGFDLQLTHKNKLGDLEYNATFNLNWARNKILRRDESQDLPVWQRTVGRSYGEKLGFVVDGMYQTWEEAESAYSPAGDGLAPGFFKFRDLNGDGKITPQDDYTFVGRSNLPELTYGLNLDLAYKGFDFSMLLQGAGLCDVALAGVYGYSNLGGVQPGTPDNTTFTEPFYDAGTGNSPYYLVEQSWRPDNPDGIYPRLSTHNSLTTRHNAWPNSGWIKNGSYLRLKSMQLGYTFPSTIIKTSYLSQLRMYISGFNLITWDHVNYMDPELPNVNNGFYPQQRMYSFGVNLTF